MKILIVTQYFYPENLPINFIASLLAKDKVQIDILTGKPNYPDGIFIKPHGFFSKIVERNKNFTIYRFPLIPRGRKNKRIGLIFNYLSFVLSAIVLSPFFFFKKKYDYIFVYANSPITKAIPAIFIGKFLKVPVILWVQDLWPDNVINSGLKLPKFLYRVIFFITAFIYKKVDLIATQSEDFINKIKNDFGTKDEKLYYLPNTIDEIFLEENEDVNLPKKLLEKKDSFKILFTGNISRHQGLEDLLAVSELIEKELKTTRKIEFFLVGEGSQKKHLEDIILKKEINNVHFLGSFPLKEMPAFIKKCDALFISLKADQNYNLTIPNKLQSYLASSKPIIGNIGGVSKKIILESEAGFVSEPGNVQKLADIIIQMSKTSKKQLEEIGKNGTNYYKDNFSNEVFLKNFRRLLTKI